MAAVLFTRDCFKYNEDDDCLGSGSFGTVYRSRLTTSGETVALKVLSSPKRLMERELQSLMNEVNILYQLRGCSYVISLLGLCITPGHYAIVMEYIDGGDLHELLIRDRDDHPYIENLENRTAMALEIAGGMDFLHSQVPPVIHRDLKSANVLVDNNYHCKIIDFGLAKARRISSQSTLHSSKESTAGTLAFIPPEMFEGNVDSNKLTKVDVYSYAIVLWQLKEMKVPYEDQYPSDVVRANVLAGVRPPLTNDSRTSCLTDVIVRCWNPRPDVRLTFREVVVLLQGVCAQLAASRSLPSKSCSKDDVIPDNHSVVASSNSTQSSRGEENVIKDVHSRNGSLQLPQDDSHENSQALPSSLPIVSQAETVPSPGPQPPSPPPISQLPPFQYPLPPSEPLPPLPQEAVPSMNISAVPSADPPLSSASGIPGKVNNFQDKSVENDLTANRTALGNDQVKEQNKHFPLKGDMAADTSPRKAIETKTSTKQRPLMARDVFVNYRHKNRLTGLLGHLTGGVPTWKMVASFLGYTDEAIRTIEGNSVGLRQTPSEILYDDWAVQSNATIGRLIEAVWQADRTDIVEYINKICSERNVVAPDLRESAV